MFKFIKAKGPHQTAERQKLQKELFSYRRTLQHGFPHKPTAMAWDPSLRLLCIGTSTGAVKVFGKPGVEFYGQHPNPIAVTRVIFLPNQGRVVTLCEDNSLHLWEVNKSSLVEVKSEALEGKLKKISTMCLEAAGKYLLLGTEGGNIYLLDIKTFSISPDIIYQDVVVQNVPANYKFSRAPGAVEVILEEPDHPNNILIGYNRGLVVLWDRAEAKSLKTFVSNQQLESLCWRNSDQFVSSHIDGSYCIWNLDKPDEPIEPVTTYGPFPCKAIPKVLMTELDDRSLIAFSGGLPRASYSDKYTVSVIHEDGQHVAFDFTSKVIDFLIINAKTRDRDAESDTTTEENGHTNGVTAEGEPECLLVLTEEELVAIDLQCEDWKMMSLPYLVSLHASAVTCSQYVSGVPEDLWEKLKNAGKAQTSHLYSTREWPIDGGELLCSKGAKPRRELLLTGHEDGTVRFWDAGGVTLTPVYKFSTKEFFSGDDLDDVASPDADDDEWPPFRKMGIFDPYSDDPRLAIKRVVLCPLSGTLIVAGTAGQVIITKFDTEVLEGELKSISMNIVNDRDEFVWKGHSKLTPRSGVTHQPRGFQATSILQLHPPAAITACVLQADWGLVAVGTAHGLALLDYIKNKPVMVKCTLNPNDLTGAGDSPISRRKSFKKSLRESFRRLRKGRSQRRTDNNKEEKQNAPVVRKPAQQDETFTPLEAKPVERQIEARPVDDSMGSFVRCLYFARTFLLNMQNTNPTLWAGTNNGTVYAFTIMVPSTSKREQEDVHCNLAKEIQLKHRAPVIAIAVLDGSNKPLPEPLEVEKGVASLPDTTQAHRVIIASEEQFKLFTLPNLKPHNKYKLTAHEGSRVRRMAFANFSTNNIDTNQTHTEMDLLCLTNLGDCLVLSIPDLKRQLNAAAVKREDFTGIYSLVFTKDAEALYLHSPSEIQRLSLSTKRVTCARCYLALPEGAREETTSEAGENEDNDAPLVNGNNESKEGSVADKTEENGAGDETPHNVTVSSSVGDITIDSVKDHLGSGEELNRRISGLCVTKTVTTIISSSTDGAVTSSSTTTTTTTSQNEGIIEKVADGQGCSLETRKIQVSDILLRAPLALAEDDAENQEA
ncbi:lethal(2) giant larvae protein homolog 1 isoform X3 [Aethina tumida]|uniref:lethal(2) giant larvae protein homolog 1 isoform X3 n=1 Tax=Aethina tumida TaxID=116153 RepID=UPI00214806EF|nr:lethal(2) giant larvae protein homolog 1 isoform X3 [Aethina tumida]